VLLLSNQKKQSIFFVSTEQESVLLEKDVSVLTTNEESIYYYSFKITNIGDRVLQQVQLTEEFSPSYEQLFIEQLTIDQIPQSEELSPYDIPLDFLIPNKTREVAFQVRVTKGVDLLSDSETSLTFFLDDEMHEILVAEEGTVHLVKSPSCPCTSLRSCSCPDSSFEIISNELFDIDDDDDWDDW
jgi:hypothetical protein